MISADSSEFLDPVYDALKDHPVYLEIAPSRTGGLRLEYIVRDAAHLDDIRRSENWKPQALIWVMFQPEIVFTGTVGLKTLEAFWNNRESKFVASLNGQMATVVENCFEWAKENEGSQAVVMKDTWQFMTTGLVPMPDGSLVKGAY